MALHDQWNIATDDSFKRRVQIAMLNAAIAISSEATVTPNHTNRANYAKAVLNDPEHYMPLFSLAVTANDATLTATSPDAAINAAVASVWNALAGVV